MQTLDRPIFLAAPLREKVTTTASSDSPVTRHFGRDEATLDAWDAIEVKLIEWGRNSSQLDEEGMQAPSPKTIQIATQLAARLCREGQPAPTRVVPDAHGGIVLEWQGKNIFESLHVDSGGAIEHRAFEQHRLVLREAWEFSIDGK